MSINACFPFCSLSGSTSSDMYYIMAFTYAMKLNSAYVNKGMIITLSSHKNLQNSMRQLHDYVHEENKLYDITEKLELLN